MRSVNNKIEALVDYILDGDYDVVAITETWIAPGDTVTCGAITADGYTLHQVSRTSERGGGVAILYKVGYKVTKSPSVETRSFESTSLCISCQTCATRVVVIYRPPSSKTTVFMSEFALLLHNLVLDPKNLLVGRLNYIISTSAQLMQAALLTSWPPMIFSNISTSQHTEPATPWIR